MVCAALVRTFYPNKRVEDKEVRLGAIQILVSVAGDLDLVADWLFYNEVALDSDVDDGLRKALLVFCVFGTLCWILIVSDGHLYTWLLRHLLFGTERYSTGRLLAIGVILEDLPQVILTSVIELSLIHI